jgi:hypothetical protein
MIPTAQIRKYKILFGDLQKFAYGPGGRRHWEEYYPFVAALWHVARPQGYFRRFFGTHDIVFERCWNMEPSPTPVEERKFQAAVFLAKQQLKAVLLHSPDALNPFLRQHRTSLATELKAVPLIPGGLFTGPCAKSPSVCLRLWSYGTWVQMADEFYHRRRGPVEHLTLPPEQGVDRLDLGTFVQYLVLVIRYSQFDIKKVSKALVNYWGHETYLTIQDLYAFKGFLQRQTLLLT